MGGVRKRKVGAMKGCVSNIQYALVRTLQNSKKLLFNLNEFCIYDKGWRNWEFVP